MHESIGIKVNIGEFKSTSRTFTDGRARKANGQFGKDQSYKPIGPTKPFIRYDFPIAFGDYQLGSVKLEFGPPL